uniref:Uncharacterized protein n=1 Tax=Cacopsylla melanoneura TaxID=428564 RepID=A0A8D8SG87_9HEMI
MYGKLHTGYSICRLLFRMSTRSLSRMLTLSCLSMINMIILLCFTCCYRFPFSMIDFRILFFKPIDLFFLILFRFLTYFLNITLSQMLFLRWLLCMLLLVQILFHVLSYFFNIMLSHMVFLEWFLMLHLLF